MKSYEFKNVNEDGVVITVGEVGIGMPKSLAVMMAAKFPEFQLETPDYTLENITGTAGVPNPMAEMLGLVDSHTIASAKAFRLGKPEGYPDEDDLFLALAEIDEDTVGVSTVGEDGIKENMFDADNEEGKGICYLPIPKAELAQYFADLGALYN